MDDPKSYASNCLNRKHLDQGVRKRWARHGSAQWLSTRENVTAEIRYVVCGQGEAMSVLEATASFGRGSATDTPLVPVF